MLKILQNGKTEQKNKYVNQIREVLIMDKTYQIKSVYGHCEAYDKYGKFMASGDTYEECEQDLINVIFSEARGDLIA